MDETRRKGNRVRSSSSSYGVPCGASEIAARRNGVKLRDDPTSYALLELRAAPAPYTADDRENQWSTRLKPVKRRNAARKCEFNRAYKIGFQI